jgi:hypothetical protein
MYMLRVFRFAEARKLKPEAPAASGFGEASLGARVGKIRVFHWSL